MTAAAGLSDPEDLRALIREVLREVLSAGSAEMLPAAPSLSAGPDTAARRTGVAEPPPVPIKVSPSPVATLPAVPPSGLPAGTIQQAGPPADGLPAPAAATARTSAAVNGRGAASATDRLDPARHVRLETDEDLREFALTILRLAENAARRRDLLAGRIRFTLSRPGGRQTGNAGRRIETGAVTERAVQAAAKAGERLVLGQRAVLTPLARDRALALGVPIERER
jgi:hypothetical protein